MTSPLNQKKDPLFDSHAIWMEVSRTGEVGKLDVILSDDVLLMPPNETSLYGKSEVMEWFTEYFEHFRIASFVETDREVIVAEGVAVEHWTYMVAIEPLNGSARIRDDGRFLTVWKRQDDGNWKISHSIWNSIRPIGSGTSLFLSLRKKGS